MYLLSFFHYLFYPLFGNYVMLPVSFGLPVAKLIFIPVNPAIVTVVHISIFTGLLFILLLQRRKIQRISEVKTGDNTTSTGTPEQKTNSDMLPSESLINIYFQLLNTTDEYVYIKNNKGWLIECNHAFTKLTGFTKDQLIGKSGSEIIGQYASVLDKVDKKVLNNKEYQSGETSIQTFEGNEIYIRFVCSPFEAPDGRWFVMNRFRDISTEKNNREQFRILAAAIEHGMATVAVSNNQGILEYVNQGFVNTTGYQKEEVIGKNPRVIKSGYHGEQYYDNIWNTIKSGNNWYGEFCNKAKNGKYYWELANIIPVMDKNNLVTHFVKVSQNITEQKFIEGQVADSEEKFKSFISRSTDAILITDEFGKIRIWNKAIESLSSISAKKALGKYIWDVQYDFLPLERRTTDVKMQLRGSLEQILRDGESNFPSTPFTQYYTRNGKNIYFQTIVFPIKTKKGYCIGSISRDITAETLATNQLEQSRHYYRQILDSMDDLLYVSDKNGNIKFGNKAFKSFFQLNGQISSGKLTEEYLREKVLPVSGANSYDNELSYAGPDDQIHTFITNTYEIHDLDNKVSSFVNVGRDISEIRNIESFNALQLELSVELGKISEREQAFKIIAKHLIKLPQIDACGIYLKDSVTKTYILKAIHGMPDEFVRRNLVYGRADKVYSLIEEGHLVLSDNKKISQYINVSDPDDIPLNAIALYPMTIGEHVVACINIGSRQVKTFTNEIIKKVILVTNQLTNHLLRIEIEEQQKRYNHDLRNIFNSHSDYIFITDEEGNIVDINPTVTSKLGYTMDDLKGKPVFELHPKEQMEHALEIFRRKVLEENARSFDFDIDLVSRSGKIIHTNTSVLHGTWDGRKVFIGISRDLSEKMRIQLELKEARDKAEAASRAKSQFLASVSHELKTPINSIKGFASLIRKNTKLSSTNLVYFDAIQASVRTLTTLINDILDFAKIERGKVKIVESVVNTGKFVDSIKQNYRILFADKWNVRFIVEQSRTVPEFILIDELRLRQIVSNLLNNAIKFTTTGFVKFEINFEGTSDNSGTLFIRIEDSGKGISNEGLHSIFTPFEQEENLDNKKYGGTGLGLAITRELVELMHGNIEVKSQLLKGTLFKVTFPNVKIPGNGNAQLQKLISENQTASAPVVILNCKHGDNEAFISLLQKNHLAVQQVPSTRQLIKLAKRSSPALLFLFPNNKGLRTRKAIEILKHEQRTKHIPLIVMDGGKNEIVQNNLVDDFLDMNNVVESLDYIMLKHMMYRKNQPAREHFNSRKLQQSMLKSVDINLLDQFKKAYESPFMKDKVRLVEMLNLKLNSEKNQAILEFRNQLSKCVTSYDIEGVNNLLKNIIESAEK